METLLQVQEICKYYRMGEVQITAVDHVSFSVKRENLSSLSEHRVQERPPS